MDWKATIPICIGGFLFTYVGADVKAFTAAPYLNLILALLILLAGDVLLAVRNGLGPAAVVASLTAVLLMDLLFELSLRQFSRVDAVRLSDTIMAKARVWSGHLFYRTKCQISRRFFVWHRLKLVRS